jgi:hypothetical protein
MDVVIDRTQHGKQRARHGDFSIRCILLFLRI